MGVGRNFFQRGNSGFFHVVAKSIFPGGANTGEISFYQLEAKRKDFILIKMSNFKIQGTRSSPEPPPDAMCIDGDECNCMDIFSA